MKRLFALPAVFVLAAASLATGCRSSHVDVTVQNQTGADVRLLEVDYPNASFGLDALPAGGGMHYRIQVQGNGPVKVQYTIGEKQQPQVTGPTLSQNAQGKLEIDLMPGGKVTFHPNLK